jgi:hypothetical protein
MEAANLLNFHPLGRSKSYHGGFIRITILNIFDRINQ